MIGNIGPILLLILYEFIRFHEVLFGKGDVLTIVYASSTLLSLAFAGYIVCEIIKPIRTLIVNIKAYRLKKIKPVLKGITRAEEFNYLFSEYEQLISDLEQSKSELVKRTTLAAIGLTTAMVAHDVRKPLTSIKLFLQALPAIKDDPAQVKRLTLEIEKSIADTNTMLNDILEFSHEIKVSDLKDHDIRSIILLSLAEVFHNKPAATIKVAYDFDHGNRAVLVDGVRLKRVFDNIITNALEAMPMREDKKIYGNLSFETKLINENKKTFIKTIITDDGSGIPNEILQKIYEPFFTHGKTNGDGLGLAIVSNVVSMLGGTIEIKNREDACGAEIILKLAAGKTIYERDDLELIYNSQELNALNTKPQEEAVLPRPFVGDIDIKKKFSILIADDEQIVRDTIRCLIESLLEHKNSHEIIDVSSGEDALDLLAQRSFTHIISDLDFGKNHISGYELARFILSKHKDTYLIIHSNKLDDKVNKELMELFTNKHLGFVQKPIQIQQLLKFISGSLDWDKPAPESTTIRNKVAHKKKILILNDDKAFNYSMRLNLRRYEFEAYAATTVAEAINYFSTNTIDYVISDINLGDNQEDGYVFLKKLRALNTTIPCVVVSGYDKDEVWPRAEPLGATSYMQTPFSIEDLVGILQ